jgi:hypothetical protein
MIGGGGRGGWMSHFYNVDKNKVGDGFKCPNTSSTAWAQAPHILKLRRVGGVVVKIIIIFIIYPLTLAAALDPSLICTMDLARSNGVPP